MTAGANPLVPLLLAVTAGFLAGAAALLAGLGFAAAAVTYTYVGIGALLVVPSAARPLVSPTRQGGRTMGRRLAHG